MTRSSAWVWTASLSPSQVWLETNTDLLRIGMTWGSFFVGGLCGLFSFVYLKVTSPAYNSGGGYTPVVLLFSFLIGFQIGVYPVPMRLPLLAEADHLIP
jgi:hypothetical protein